MSQHVIRAQNLHFAYGLKKALDDLDLNVPAGSIYGLIGPNGCGKSTLLRLIMGQGRPFRGSVEVFGQDPHAQPVSTRLRIGYVPQKNDLDSELTVEQTLTLFQEVYGELWSSDVAQSGLQRLGLDSMKNTRVRNLSGGYQQRLALLTAVAVQPQMLLLDEPTTGLDAVVRRDFIETIIEFMAEEPQRSVVISSHLLSEIEPLIDHVGLMSTGPEGGKMLIEASLEQLKERALIVEVDNPPADLLNHRSLLSRQVEPQELLIFWLEDEENRELIRTRVKETGGHCLEQAGLDEIFVRLTRNATPLAQRRVAAGRMLETVQ